MRVHRKTLRKRPPPAAVEGISWADVWLARAASLSQPLLLVLAVFGYFYTVVPAYQKELLSEQIAAKEIELGRLQREIDANGPTMQRLQAERVALEKQVRLLDTQKADAERAVAELRLRQSVLDARNRDLEESRSRLASDVAASEARAYHDSFSGSVMIGYLQEHPDPYKIVEAPTYEVIAKFLLTPFAVVNATLAVGDSRYLESAGKVSRAVKEDYHAKVRAALEAGKDALSRPHDDVNALIGQIERGMAESAVDPTPSDRFNELRYETRTRLVKMLYDSRKREMDRTQQFLDSQRPGGKSSVDVPSKP